MYNELTYNNVKIRISDGDIANLRLLQVDNSKAKLSQLRSGKDIPQAIINCSYFTTSYVLGRNQGDVRQDTASFNEQKYLSFATTDTGYKCGELEFWDAEKSQCGFTPACIIIKDGRDVQMASTSFVTYDGKMKLATCVSMFGILDDKRTCILVTCDKGLSGYQLASYLKSMYKLDFLCILDGGGSTEHIVNGTIVQKSTDGTERSMFNGLALIQPKEEPLELYYPCVEGWGSQGFHSGHKGLDFGWVHKANTDILACADGVVEFEGYYNQQFASGVVKPIGVLIRHTQFSKEYDYVSIYWHLASTIVNKGDVVKAGQKIGLKGNSGLSSGTHLHFQLLKLRKGEAIPDQHYPNKADNWGKASVDPTELLYVHKGQLYMNDKSQFKLKDWAEPETEESKEDILIEDVTSLKAQISDLNGTITQLQLDLANCKSINEGLEASIKTLKDDNLSLAAANGELESENNSLKTVFNTIKELIK